MTVQSGIFSGPYADRSVATGRQPADHELCSCDTRFGGQATKGIRWMPWRQEAMKDVVSCDKPRGAANERRSVDFRMGKPLPRKSVEPGAEDR